MLFAQGDGQGWLYFWIVIALFGLGMKKIWKTVNHDGQIGNAAKGGVINMISRLFK